MRQDRQDPDDEAAIVAAHQQALMDGTMVFSDYPPDELERILAQLPAGDIEITHPAPPTSGAE